jgi:pyridoxamine 5'-phosphate oxidase
VASFISKQSTEIESRAALEKNFEEAKHKFKEGGVPYPKTWGGYLLQPSEVEFFLYGDFRLNDRFLFESKEGQWSWRRLQP